MTSRTTQACVACKRRKVRCDGESSCSQCKSLNLQCLYVAANRSRTSTVRNSVLGTLSSFQNDSQSASLAANTRSHLFPKSFFLGLISDYCLYVLPMLPIIPESELRSAIDKIDHGDETWVPLVYSIAAQTLNATRERDKTDPQTSKILFTEALTRRKPVISLDQINVQSVMTSVYNSVGLSADHRDQDIGYFYMCEAIAGLLVLRIDRPELRTADNDQYKAQRERLYWLLFIHERFQSIEQYRPAVLKPLPRLPEADPLLPPLVNKGFELLVNLFQTIDTTFVTNWIDRQSPALTLSWVERKQTELAGNMGNWNTRVEALLDMQQVDLIITQCWLRTLVWQMALAKFVLMSETRAQSNKDFLSLTFPIRLSRRLRTLLASKPLQAVEVHGSGILIKIFDIACTDADLIEHMVARRSNQDDTIAIGYLEDFLFLYAFLLNMSKFYHVERSILTSKLEKMRSLFPHAFGGRVEMDELYTTFSAIDTSVVTEPSI